MESQSDKQTPFDPIPNLVQVSNPSPGFINTGPSFGMHFCNNCLGFSCFTSFPLKYRLDVIKLFIDVYFLKENWRAIYTFYMWNSSSQY